MDNDKTNCQGRNHRDVEYDEIQASRRVSEVKQGVAQQLERPFLDDFLPMDREDIKKWITETLRNKVLVYNDDYIHIAIALEDCGHYSFGIATHLNMMAQAHIITIDELINLPLDIDGFEVQDIPVREAIIPFLEKGDMVA